MPYLLEKSRFGINFFAKRNTILLLYVYQVFIFLQDHLHFFLHFFFTFMEQLFLDDPISGLNSNLSCYHILAKVSPLLKLAPPLNFVFDCIKNSSFLQNFNSNKKNPLYHANLKASQVLTTSFCFKIFK